MSRDENEQQEDLAQKLSDEYYQNAGHEQPRDRIEEPLNRSEWESRLRSASNRLHITRRMRQ